MAFIENVRLRYEQNKVRTIKPRWGFLMSVFFVVVVYSLAVYGSMAVMSIGAALVGARYLYDRLNLKERSTSRSPLLAPSLALALACAWSLIWAKISGLTFFSQAPDIQWGKDLAKLWHLAFPFVLAALFQKLSAEKLRQIFRVWFGASVIIAMVAIVQHYVPLFKPMALPDRGLEGLYHATGFTGFHLSFASILIFPNMVAYALLFVRARRSWFDRSFVALSACALLLTVATILTYSKMAWIALPASLLLLGFIGLKKWGRWSFVALVLFATALGSQSEAVKSRLTGLRTINDRYLLWQVNGEMIRQFPFFGVGWHHNSDLSYAYYKAKGVNSFQDLWIHEGFASHAHNNIIDQWATTGTVGFLAFLWWNAIAILLTYRVYKSNHQYWVRGFALGILVAWLGFHLNGMSQTNFWDAKVMHQLGWVTAMILALSKLEGRLPTNETTKRP